MLKALFSLFSFVQKLFIILAIVHVVSVCVINVNIVMVLR